LAPDGCAVGAGAVEAAGVGETTLGAAMAAGAVGVLPTDTPAAPEAPDPAVRTEGVEGTEDTRLCLDLPELALPELDPALPLASWPPLEPWDWLSGPPDSRPS
jgi:hypothetical protein